MKRRFQPAMNNFYLVPVSMVDPAVKLAASIGTDRYHKGRPLHLLVEAEEFSRVDLVHPVHRETVGRSAECVCQHHDFRRVGTEMSMHMRRAEGLQPWQD